MLHTKSIYTYHIYVDLKMKYISVSFFQYHSSSFKTTPIKKHTKKILFLLIFHFIIHKFKSTFWLQASKQNQNRIFNILIGGGDFFTRQNSMSWMNKVMAVCFANNTAKILVSNKAALQNTLAENRQIGVNLGANWRSPYWRNFL